MESKDSKKAFEEAIREQLDKELDNRETFPPAIREKIKETYKKLWEQRLAWLKEHEKKEE